MGSERWKDVTHDDMWTVHVVPIGDLKRHRERGATCWCNHRVETFEGGGRLVSHNSMDGRELIEQHGIQ